MAVKVKICGITNLKDAQAAIECGADFLGFIFAKSPRRIGKNKAARIIRALPAHISKVGVFVNEEPQVVRKISRLCRLDVLQFHGEETPAYCSAFRKAYKVIKAFRIKDKNTLKDLKRYNVDGYLLDTYVKGIKGGTGKTFNWRMAKWLKRESNSIILSGGLNPDNVAEAVKKVRSYAVDVSSGIELRPGKKDHKLMQRFIAAAKRGKIRGNKGDEYVTGQKRSFWKIRRKICA